VKLFVCLYDLLTTVQHFAGIGLLRDGVHGRRYSSFPVVWVDMFARGSSKILFSGDCSSRQLFAQVWHCAQVGTIWFFMHCCDWNDCKHIRYDAE